MIERKILLLCEPERVKGSAETTQNSEITEAISTFKTEKTEVVKSMVDDRTNNLEHKVEHNIRINQIKQIVLSNPEIAEIWTKLEPILNRGYKSGRKMRKGLEGAFYSKYGDNDTFLRTTIGERKREIFVDAMKENFDDWKQVFRDQNNLNQIAKSDEEKESDEDYAEYLKEDQIKKLREEACIWSDIAKSMGIAAINKAGTNEFERRSAWIQGAIKAIENGTINQYEQYQEGDAKQRGDMYKAFLLSAGRNPFCPPQYQAYQRKNINRCQREVDGILKHVKTMNNSQKLRLGNMASLAGGIATIYAIGNVLGRRGKSKTPGRIILGATATLMGGSYVADGSLMGLGGALKGILTGGSNGCKLKKILGMFGLEDGLAGLFGDNAPEGAEQLTLQQGVMANVLPADLTYKECVERGYFTIKNNKVGFGTDSQGNLLLAQYRASKGKNKKAQQVQVLADQEKEPDTSLAHLRLKSKFVDLVDEKINLKEYKKLSQKLNNYLTKNNLKTQDDTIIGKYYSGEYSRNELMSHPEAFAAKEKATINTRISNYNEADPLTVLNHKNDPTLSQLPINTVIANSTHNGFWYDINRSKVINTLPKGSQLRTTLLNSSDGQKADRTIAINQIAHTTQTNHTTFSGLSQTFGEYITSQEQGLKNLSQAYTKLNEQSLTIIPSERANIQKEILNAQNQNHIDAIIKKGIANKKITFNINSYPLLENVEPSYINQLPTLANLTAELPTKLQILARTEHIRKNTEGKLPIPLELTGNGSTVTLGSYGQGVSFDITKPKGPFTLTNTITTYNEQGNSTTKPNTLPIQATSIAEALQLAQLTNLATGMMRYGGADTTPRERQDGKLQFSQQDSFLERGKDIRRSGFDKKAIASWIDTDITSKEAIASHYPILTRGDNGTKYKQWLNNLGIRHRESDPEKIKELKGSVDRTIQDTINNHLDEGRGFEIKKQNGHIVTIGFENTKDGTETITLDMMDNQVMSGLSPLIVPGSPESATRLAVHLLLVKKYITSGYNKAKAFTTKQRNALNTRRTNNPLGKAIKATVDGLQGIGEGMLNLTGNLAELAANIVKGLARLTGPARSSQANGNTANGQANGNTANGQANGNTANGQANGNTANGQANGNTANGQANK